jgi:hypothetical protein
LVELYIEAQGNIPTLERLLGRKGFALLDKEHTLPANILYDSLQFSEVPGVDTDYYKLPSDCKVFNQIVSKCGNPNLLFGVLSDWANSNGVGAMEYYFIDLHDDTFTKQQFARHGISKYSRALDKKPEVV